mgnify:CR=1 FL=1
MKLKHIVLILIPINVLLAYLVYNSVSSELAFQEKAEIRLSENIQKLKDLRQLQICFKKTYGNYANNFDVLNDFLLNDSLPIIRAIGERPDTLTDAQALEIGIITRDTTFAPAISTVFDETYLSSRNPNYPLDIKALYNIPQSDKKYNITSGFVEKGKVVEAVELTELHTAGVYEGHLNVELIKIFFKGKYDGCYERPEYFYLNFYRKGSTFNCFRVGHGVPEKEIYDPDDPYLRNANSQIKKWIRENSIELPKIMLGSTHLYFSRLVYGKIYGVSYSIDPSILNGPEISFFTEESSEYHKYNIKNYPEHEKIMQQWLSISSNRHKAFEKAVNAKERHLLNLSELVSSDTSLNSNQSEDTVEQLKKLNDLYKSGVLTKDEFEKAKKKILN